MVLLREKVKNSEEKIEVIFKILDKMKDDKIEQDKKETARIAVENYKNLLINRIFKFLLIPIILLIISAIINWVLRFKGG